MPKLAPFRQVSEYDVINLFAHATAVDLARGTLVKPSVGWKNTDEPVAEAGGPGAAYANTVSNRYATTAKVATAGTGDAPLGMTLYDIKETDENGEKLIFNPRKAAEMQVVLSGQTVPIVTRGMFLYSGATLAAQTPAVNTRLYCGANGELTTGFAGAPLVNQVRVAIALGAKDTNDNVLIYLDCAAGGTIEKA